VELEPEYIKEDFLPPSFLQMQKDYDMEDSSSTIAHVGWDEENSGMNVHSWAVFNALSIWLLQGMSFLKELSLHLGHQR